MRRWYPASRFTVVLILAGVTLGGVTGCSRQVATPGSGGTTGSGQLPFDRVSDSSGISPTAAFASEGVPVGTELTIRLRSALSSADARVGDSFEGVLDGSVIIAGTTVVPQGALVTGRVVATKASGRPYDPGYLRVTLTTIAMNGKSIPLQTSSLFAKGGSYEKRKAAVINRSDTDGKGAAAETAVNSRAGTVLPNTPNHGDVRFSTGHRLTFRLTQPLHLSG